MSELGDKEFEIGNKRIGGSTLIKFNLKTLFWILAFLYVVGGYFYFDLREELRAASEVSKNEKEKFMHDVEEE